MSLPGVRVIVGVAVLFVAQSAQANGGYALIDAGGRFSDLLLPYTGAGLPTRGPIGRLPFGPEAMGLPSQSADSPALGVIDDSLPPEEHAPRYDLQRFGQHVHSIRWDLLGFGAGITALGITRWDWGSSGFHFVSEGFFGKDTFNGGMDKLGHAWMGYALSDYLTWRIEHSSSDIAYADVTGAALSMGIMTGIELSDGLSSGYGFSYEDFIMDAAGAGFSLLRRRVPGLADLVDFRLQYIPSGEGSGWDFATDYMGQKYVLALKPAGVRSLQDSPLRFVELQLGYYARGFGNGHAKSDREQNAYVGLGLNVAEVYRTLAQDNNSTWSRAVEGVFHHIQVPYTYLPVEHEF